MLDKINTAKLTINDVQLIENKNTNQGKTIDLKTQNEIRE